MSADLTAFEKALRGEFASVVLDVRKWYAVLPFSYDTTKYRKVPLTRAQRIENASYERNAKAARRALAKRISAAIRSVEHEYGVKTYLDSGSDEDASEGYVVEYKTPHAPRWEPIPVDGGA